MSTVGSIGSTANAALSQTVKPNIETGEAKGAPDQDRDGDDASKKNVQAASPTVNMNGQTVGQVINITA